MPHRLFAARRTRPPTTADVAPRSFVPKTVSAGIDRVVQLQRTAGNRATVSLLSSVRNDVALRSLQRVSFSYVETGDQQSGIRRFKKVEMTGWEVAIGDNGGDRNLGIHTGGASDCAIILTWDGNRTVSCMHPVASRIFGSADKDAKRAVEIVRAASKVVLVFGSFYSEPDNDHLAVEIITQADKRPDEQYIGHSSAAMTSDGTVLLSPEVREVAAPSTVSSSKKKGCCIVQ